MAAGKTVSEKKAAAARENGKKGGRPRLEPEPDIRKPPRREPVVRRERDGGPLLKYPPSQGPLDRGLPEQWR